MMLTNIQLLTLLQVFMYCSLVLVPILWGIKQLLVKHGPEYIQLDNFPDNVVRLLAMTLFILMIGSIFVILTYFPAWYTLLAPLELILLYIFIYVYKNME